MADEKNVTVQNEHSHIDAIAAVSASYAGHSGVDAELAKYANTEGIQIDDETSKKIFWTINRRILAAMLGTYFCQSLDKGTLGFSSIMGIQKDANLVGSDYSWLGTILYMGVLVGELPTNLLLQKLPVAKYLAANVFCWGVVIACSAAATNWGALMTVRFLLGIFESCVQPAFIILTAMWYTKREQTVLTSLWYCMTGVQLMVGGLLAYATSQYTGPTLRNWQLLFLVLGCATCVWGAFIGWWLPDSPMKAKCFTEEQKLLMIERVRVNETGIQNRKYKRYQVITTLSDPLTWCYVLLQLCSTLIIGGLGVFSNLIISSFGFTLLQTQLLNIAQGGVTIMIMISSAALAQTTGQTCLVMHAWTIPAIIGTAVIFSITPSSATRVGLLIAFYCTQFFLAQGNLIYSLIIRNVAGQTKKSLTLTMAFIAFAAGNMGGPQIFQTTDAPRYLHGFTAHFCLYVIYNVIVAVTRFIITRRNAAKRAAAVAERSSENSALDGKIRHAHAFDDLTDNENPDFRYVF